MALLPLERIITENEGWLAARVLRYAKEGGYTRYTSTLEEAWRLSIAGLSSSLVKAIHSPDSLAELSADIDFTADPVSSFGIEEARRHRSRGITLAMFLGLMKYYRRSYLDLVRCSALDRKTEEQCLFFIERFFDRIEIGFCAEWGGVSDSRGMEELEEANRLMTNEKNRLLTILESIPSPVILLGTDGCPDLMNRAAVEIFGESSTPGIHYYRMRGKREKRLVFPLRARLRRFVKEGVQEAHFEESIETPTGRRHYLVTLQRLLDISEKFCGITVILTDITARKAAEDALQFHVEETEERIRSRTAELVDINSRLTCEIEERRRTEEALRRSERFFHAILDSLSAHVAILNHEGEILAVNRAWQNFADENGYQGVDYGVGEDYLAICDGAGGGDAVTASAVAGGIREIIAGRCGEFHLEYPCHSPTEKRWFQVRATLLDGGSAGRVAVVHENISEVKKAQEEVLALNRDLEQRVRQRTGQLELSTREMEEFCYAVSHDLRAHLARLEGFGRGLYEDCADRVDDQARYYVDRICRISVELRRVVDALLQLARVSRIELTLQKVDLSALAQSSVEEFRRIQPFRTVRVLIASGVKVSGDVRLLGIALRHLLDNAWKFTSRREDALIEFGVTERHGLKLYFVRDNGAGFDQRYASRLFQPFQRIHAPGEFEGMGIGLATVQRIIRRHGGRIWTESEVGKGATFYFTLPSK